MQRIDALHRVGRPDASWTKDDLPVVIADDRVVRVADLPETLVAERAAVFDVNQETFDIVCARLRTPVLYVNAMRVADLSGLSQLGELRELAIVWNTKLTSLDQVGALTSLRTLILEDTPKVADLAPLAALSGLEALEFSGGIWSKNKAHSLEPLSGLAHLREISLLNARFDEGGLRPLATCRALTHLRLSNRFKTDDYAYLSVALPDAVCDHFASHIRLEKPIAGNDVMVVGSRKPFLNSTTDADRIEKYASAFTTLQARFRAELTG